jgi:transcriptional regulator with XRE-family HTH domain
MYLEKFSNIGKRIKELRLQQQLSLEDLSAKSNIPVTTLSNVENFRTIPDLVLLNDISQGIGIPLNHLFTDLTGFQKNEPYIIVRKDEHEMLDRQDSQGVEYQIILTKYVSNCLFTPTIVTVKKGIKRPPVSTNGLEYMLVLSGSIITGLNDTRITLHEGDSLFYDARMPHFMENEFETDCVLLSIYLMNE